MRAFLAIPVLPPALEAFHAIRAALVADVPDVRWAPAGSAHLTLHFFGSVSAQESERALAALRPLLSRQPVMSLRLRGLGSFPGAGDPRVLWCGVDGDCAQLTDCAFSCRAALSRAGFPVEDRLHRAHCTLGRPRQPWPAVARDRWEWQARANPTTPSFAADRAILYESLTASGGVAHVPREVLMFGATTA